MNEQTVKNAYDYARESYEELGIDTDAAMKKMAEISLSIPCWQGDDVLGFEKSGQTLSGGIMATGNHPGRARNGEELRADMSKAFTLIPGKSRANIHAMYLESDTFVDRDEIEPKHFEGWIEWAKELDIGLDFNPSLFSHPKSASGYTLSHRDAGIRKFWIEHCKRSREISAHIGKKLGKASVDDLWIIDGSKDLPANRMLVRQLLVESLDEIYKKKYNTNLTLDSVESKLFGLGSESFVAGSHDFYLGYAAKHNMMITYDTGHFHPTENVSDKISSTLLFVPGILLHLSRGIRWDSDHIATLSEEMIAIMKEINRADAWDRVCLSLDYFDASVNRLLAWVVGSRATLKAVLIALLEPVALLEEAEKNGDLGRRLAIMEEMKTMPWNAVWDMYCLLNGVPVRTGWLEEVKNYETQVTSKRV